MMVAKTEKKILEIIKIYFLFLSLVSCYYFYLFFFFLPFFLVISTPSVGHERTAQRSRVACSTEIHDMQTNSKQTKIRTDQ